VHIRKPQKGGADKPEDKHKRSIERYPLNDIHPFVGIAGFPYEDYGFKDSLWWRVRAHPQYSPMMPACGDVLRHVARYAGPVMRDQDAVGRLQITQNLGIQRSKRRRTLVANAENVYFRQTT